MQIFELRQTISKHKTILAEIIRFGIVGFVSFVVDFGVFFLLQELGLKHIHNGVLISTTVGFLVSLAVHYFMTTYWVFRNHSVNSKKAHAKAATLFVLTNVIGCVLCNLIMWLGVTVLSIHYIIVKLFATLIVMLWNFIFQKFVIYKGKN